VLVVWKEVSVAALTVAARRDVDNEIDILAAVDHVNIIAYMTHFIDTTMLYIEMEYADG
jgi:hypothetical protein